MLFLHRIKTQADFPLLKRLYGLAQKESFGYVIQ